MASNAGLYCRKAPLDSRNCDHSTEVDMPDGYVARAEWAARKMRTHSQHKCPGCDLYRVWTLRAKPLSDKQLLRIFGYVPESSGGNPK